jgi:rhamnosyl/mannosyltransferase
VQRLRAVAFRPIEHAVLGGAARILCASPTYPAGSAALRRHAERVTILPFGIDLAPYLSPARAATAEAQRLRAEHGEPLWLSVGRLVYYKGIANAIDALAAVPGKLLVVGTGPLEPELRRRAGARGVADRVVWLGHVSHDVLVGALLAATALWFPSNARSEAFGLVQVEAMASGCPVINAAIPDSGVPWVSRDGESGLTVAVDDPGALAAAARRLLEEPGLRARLAQGGRARAIAEFDQEVMARRTLAVYAEARAAPSARGAGAVAG